ncbi:MAG: PriCT-2 domain-containing protein, partial [Rhodopila sp.]
DVETVALRGLDDIANLLPGLIGDPHACVIRGQLIDPGKTHHVRRLLHGDAATFRDVPREWVALDIEGIERPADLPATDLAGCAAVALRKLPAAFTGARCIVQASAKHGVKPDIRLRLWFWLSRPVPGEELKSWLAGTPADPAVFGAVQPIFTAAPVFLGGAMDPLPARLAELPGQAVVAVPAPELLAPPEVQHRSPLGNASLPPAGGNAPAQADPEEIARALADIPNAGGWTEWNRVGMACFAATGGSGAGFTAFDAWSARNAAYDPAVTRERWDNYTRYPPTQIGAGTIFHMAGKGAGRTSAQQQPSPIATPADPPFALPTATMTQVHSALARDAGDFFNDVPLPPIGQQFREPLKGRALRPVTVRGKGHRPRVILRRDEPGSGKTTTFADFAGHHAAVRKMHGIPHRIIHMVPEHTTLPPQLLGLYQAIGLKVAHLKGRGDPRNRKPKTDLCGDLDAVADAYKIGESPARAACGALDGPHCPLFSACAYQAQFAELVDADVIVAASTYLFQQLPAAARKGAWCVIVEEGFAALGDVHTRTPLDTFRVAALERAPVLSNDSTPDRIATDEYAQLQAKLIADFDAAPDGYLLQTSVTDADIKRAIKLNGRRKVEANMVPGMSKEARREAVEAAAINGQIRGINAVWRSLRGRTQGTLPGVPGPGAGRLELFSEDRRSGTKRYVETHGQRHPAPWLKRRPIAILSGSMTLADVRRFFPKAIEQATPHAVAPHAETELILGAWGTRSLVEGKKKLGYVRDYITFRGIGRGAKGIIAPLACVEALSGMPDTNVMWHGANAGSNSMVDCGLVASIGGPYARPSEIARIAAARTGEAVPPDAAVRSTVAVLMADGSGQLIPTLRYEHPAAQAVHESIFNTAIDQAIMRSRPQLRTACSSVLDLILANVQPSHPVTCIRYWRDIPHRLLHMIVRDRVTFNVQEMTALYPAEFPTADAAERARRRWGQTGPDYTNCLHRVLQEDPRGWHRIDFQPSGQGHKPQCQYCPTEALAATLAAIKADHTPVAEPIVSQFKARSPAPADDSPSAFYEHYEREGESSPAPDPLPPSPAGLRAGFAQSHAAALDLPPDG